MFRSGFVPEIPIGFLGSCMTGWLKDSKKAEGRSSAFCLLFQIGQKLIHQVGERLQVAAAFNDLQNFFLRCPGTGWWGCL